MTPQNGLCTPVATSPRVPAIMGEPVQGASGFQGSVTSLALVDVIQLQAGNRFSGILSIASAGRTGRLFFDQGDVVHAESGGLAGEPAVHQVLGWPGGTFHLHPGVMALARTITKQVSHLLLDALQAIDEGRHAGPPAPAPVLEFASPAVTAWARLDAFKVVAEVPGVACVARFGRDGAPVGDGHPRSESLAARAQHLAAVCAGAVGQAFGLGELGSASLRAGDESLLLFQVQGNSLCVAVEPGTRNEALEAQVRAALARIPEWSP